MATKSWLVTVSVSVDQDEAADDAELRRASHELWQVVTNAVSDRFADRPDIIVEGQSIRYWRLDGQPDVGRCAVCDRWVYDIENATAFTPRGVSRGAVVGGSYLCDEHLPPNHPHCFGKGHDGPVPPDIEPQPE